MATVKFEEVSLPALNGPANVIVIHNSHTNEQFVVKVLRTESAKVVAHYERRDGFTVISNEMTPR